MAARQDSASRLARVKGSWIRQGDGAPGNRKASPTYRKLNTLPEWRNGKRSGFKIRRPYGLEGSSPSSGTSEIAVKNSTLARTGYVLDARQDPLGGSAGVARCADWLLSRSARSRDRIVALNGARMVLGPART